jgi:hypothetical protein
MSRDNERAVLGVILGVIVMFGLFWWNKPNCRDGYIPSITIFTGWTCVPGYKP